MVTGTISGIIKKSTRKFEAMTDCMASTGVSSAKIGLFSIRPNSS